MLVSVDPLSQGVDDSDQFYDVYDIFVQKLLVRETKKGLIPISACISGIPTHPLLHRQQDLHSFWMKQIDGMEKPLNTYMPKHARQICIRLDLNT